jgi:hypothetical protein
LVRSKKFSRAALYEDPASMPAEIKLYDIDGDGELEILATVYDTSFAKDSSSGSVFIWKLLPQVECTEDSDCGETEVCTDNACRPLCGLTIKHKKIRSVKLSKPRKVALKITGGEDFDVFGKIDIGPLAWFKARFNSRKNKLKLVVIVPAGLSPGIIPIRVGDCYGEVEIL